MSTQQIEPTIDVRRSEDRFTSEFGWLDSKHSFSFGHHFDPANTHHGLLLVNNDDVVDPGTGFETHPHRDMEIVTWVMQGSLVHQDSTGHNGVIYPGLAQRMSAGRGILHSEKNDSWRLERRDRTGTRCTSCRCGSCPTRAASRRATSSSRSTTSCSAGGLVPVASGMDKHDGEAAIRIKNKYAALYAARLAARPVRRAARGAVPAPVRAPRHGRRWRARARWPPATRCGSPPPAGRR